MSMVADNHTSLGTLLGNAKLVMEPQLHRAEYGLCERK